MKGHTLEYESSQRHTQIYIALHAALRLRLKLRVSRYPCT